MAGKVQGYGEENIPEPDEGIHAEEAGQYPSVIKNDYRTAGGFKIRMEARLKNADLIGAREMAGLNAREAAEMIGMSYQYYLNCESMRIYPGRETQEKICKFYRSMGIFLLEDDVFPEELRYVQTKHSYAKESIIPEPELLSLSHMDRKMLPVVENEAEKRIEAMELNGWVQKALDKLTYREQEVIKMRLGFYGREMSLKEIGTSFNVTGSRIGQIEARAIRKLRHPDRAKMLMSFLEPRKKA
jgi:RNA polymerase sigma factor (sigma-70 family)